MPDYPNRSDLRVPQPKFTGQPYGEATRQAAATRAVPVGAPPTDAMPAGSPPFARPTDRPDEPVTAGAPVGPGPNEVTGMPLAPANGSAAALAEELRAIYLRYPNPNLAALLAAAEGQPS